MLKEDRKEIIKSFNNIALFLVYIDIITWNYNSIGLTLAPYFRDSGLMMYNLEMYKLFEFFKSPFVKFLEQIKKDSKFIADGINNKLIEPSHLKSFQLFPHMAMYCENEIKMIPLKQSFEAQKAQLNLWNNQEVVEDKEKNIEEIKEKIKQIPLELWKDTGIYAEDLIDMGYSPEMLSVIFHQRNTNDSLLDTKFRNTSYLHLRWIFC